MPSASLPRRSHSEAVTHARDFLQPAGPILSVAPPCFRFSFTLYSSCNSPAHTGLLSTRPTTSSSVAHGLAPMPRGPCPAVRCPSCGPGMGTWPVLNLHEPPPTLPPSIPWMQTSPKPRSSVLKVAAPGALSHLLEATCHFLGPHLDENQLPVSLSSYSRGGSGVSSRVN